MKCGRHVIMGNSEDYHAVAVKWAMAQLGESATIWDGIGCDDEDCISIRLTSAEHSMILGQLSESMIGSLWMRRPVPFKPLQDVSPQSRRFVANELIAAHLSCCAMLGGMAEFVVDSKPEEPRHSKAWQLRAAVDAGFTVPATLITNDYEQISEFVRLYAPVIVKFFTQHFWTDLKSMTVREVGPSVLTNASLLPRGAARVCPAIYQALVRKAYEIRVTVIGERIFAAKISSTTGEAFLDWRPMCGKRGLVMSAIDLDAGVQRCIRTLMGRLGLNYACIDLAVDVDGLTHFFEINTGGQFLFVDDYVPEFNLLGAFAAMLSARSTAYDVPGNDELTVQAFERSREFADLRSKKSVLGASDKFVTQL